MEHQDVEKLLSETLSLAEVHVSGEGSHLNVIAVGDVFDGASRVKKQQLVYGPLKDKIADGSLHAISIKAFTPEQWEKERKFNVPGSL